MVRTKAVLEDLAQGPAAAVVLLPYRVTAETGPVGKGEAAVPHTQDQVQRATAAQAARLAVAVAAVALALMESPPVPAVLAATVWCVFTLGKGLSCTQ
jgi:hypothetical protein